jgi:hypothetical protein
MFTAMVISNPIPYKDLQPTLSSKSQIVYVGDGGAGDYEKYGSCYRCAQRYIERKYLFTSLFKKCLTYFVGQYLHDIY